MKRYELRLGDCLQIMQEMEDQSVDLVLGSPPYEDLRTYGINFKRSGEEWVSWMVAVCDQAQRITRGFAILVIGSGVTRNFCWSATPAMLVADLHRAGYLLRRPLIYYRYGVPGSGGPDYLRNNYEWIIVLQNRKLPGAVPFVNPYACSRPLRHKCPEERPRLAREPDGQRRLQRYHQRRKTANPGDVIQQTFSLEEVEHLIEVGDVVHCKVGGYHMGHPLAHENEACYSLELAKFLIQTFSPDDGLVLDPFVGSGTTLHAACETNRRSIGIDVRPSQIEIAEKRLSTVTPAMFNPT